jgi:hypothetical protein
MITAHISPSILFGRKLQDAHVCYGQPDTGTFEREHNEFEICDEGSQYTYRYGQTSSASEGVTRDDLITTSGWSLGQASSKRDTLFVLFLFFYPTKLVFP